MSGLLTHLFFLLAVSSVPLEKRSLTVDLANQKPGEVVTETVPPARSYSVSIINRIPGKLYSYSALLLTREIPPLDLKPLETRGETRGSDCTALVAATRQLQDSPSELVVPHRRASLLDAISEVGISCPNEKTAAEIALSECDVTAPMRYDIGRRQYLEVTVTRAEDGKILTWKKLFVTPDVGEWLASYGFTFLPSDDAEYFTRAGTDADAGKFIVTRKAERRRFDFAPSVFFNWYPQWLATADLNIGPAAGLGFDFDTPVVFAGLSLLYNQNIGLVGGGVVHQVRRLAGEYREGQKLGEDLESDRLTEKTYRLSYFFGLTFRFGSRPSGFGETAKVSGKTPPEVEPTPTPTASPTSPASPSATVTPNRP